MFRSLNEELSRVFPSVRVRIVRLRESSSEHTLVIGTRIDGRSLSWIDAEFNAGEIRAVVKWMHWEAPADDDCPTVCAIKK